MFLYATLIIVCRPVAVRLGSKMSSACAKRLYDVPLSLIPPVHSAWRVPLHTLIGLLNSHFVFYLNRYRFIPINQKYKPTMIRDDINCLIK